MARVRRKLLAPPGRLRVPKCPRIIVRLLSRVVVDPRWGCWVWQGYKDENGYGRIKILGASVWVHRASKALFKRRAIPAGRELDHYRKRCVGPSCCNPDHLRERDPIANARDGGRRRHAPKFNDDIPF